MNVTPTITQFCHQTWQLTAQIQLSQTSGDVTYIVTDRTPFHPVSYIWPDHPADRGAITYKDKLYPLVDCLVGAVELCSNTLYVDKAIPVKRDQAGWAFVVVHVVEKTEAVFCASNSLLLSVDKTYQQALSRGHSAGHLAFLALNKVLTEQGYWRKDADRKDTLGNYDFNSYAQETSFVSEDKCVDSYRLGKTLRKRGLNSADMVAQLSMIENQVNQVVNNWLQQGTEVVMHCNGEALTDSRYWRCELGETKLAEIPCGGTHVHSLKEYTSIRVSLQETSPNYIEMQTDVTPATDK